MPDLEFVSIIDCELCRAIPPFDKVCEFRAPSEQVAPPLPSSWTSLSTIAVLSPGFRSPWGNRDELRMCPSCGTYYEYRQAYDPGDNDPFSSAGTDWYLSRLTPQRAATLLRRAQRHQTGSEPGRAKRRYSHIIRALRSDLGRVQGKANLAIKKYVIEALTEHYLVASDWDTLKTSLLDHPDPAVRVDTASRVLWPVLRVMDDFGKKDVLGKSAHKTYRLITKERRRFLIAVLAEGLSHDESMASDTGGEPARTDVTALSMLRHCGPYMSLTAAIPALAAWLAADIAWRRERARDLLVKYVERPWRPSKGPNTVKLRARDVLEHRAFGRGKRRLVAVHLDDVVARRQRDLGRDSVFFSLATRNAGVSPGAVAAPGAFTQVRFNPLNTSDFAGFINTVNAAPNRALALRQERQRAGPARRGEHDAFEQQQDDGEPRPHRHAIRQAAVERVERARAQDPEHDAVNQLDLEDRDSSPWAPFLRRPHRGPGDRRLDVAS